jgi:hypothetical protein
MLLFFNTEYVQVSSHGCNVQLALMNLCANGMLTAYTIQNLSLFNELNVLISKLQLESFGELKFGGLSVHKSLFIESKLM